MYIALIRVHYDQIQSDAFADSLFTASKHVACVRAKERYSTVLKV